MIIYRDNVFCVVYVLHFDQRLFLLPARCVSVYCNSSSLNSALFSLVRSCMRRSSLLSVTDETESKDRPRESFTTAFWIEQDM